MILSAGSILQKIKITPMLPRQRHPTGLTGGLSFCGYDLHVREGGWLWPGKVKLFSAVEEMALPDDVCAMVHDKSTLARRGLTVQNTFIEPGWRGFLTLELVNHNWTPRQVIAGQPIAQVVFHQLDAPARTYDGRYQDQPPFPVKA